MGIKFYSFITVLSFISAEGRLIHKNKTKTLEVIPTENPNPTIRLTRGVDDDPLTGFSKEETVSDEFLQSYNRRHKTFSESKPKYVRSATDTKQSVQKIYPKIEVSSHKINKKHAIVLVKKPIPKFSDIDYEDDFQTRMNKARSIFDDGDHEDEDFNLDDYDFDVNHDEFLSGRKPLEPRISLKDTDVKDTALIPMRPEFKIQTKIDNPGEHRAVKREPLVMFPKETSDYYDDVATSTEANKQSQESENDYSDEGDSKETKKAIVRSIRSWDIGSYMNKFEDKTSIMMTKFLSVLPMFPQVPRDKTVNTHD